MTNDTSTPLPGSAGEHALQERLGMVRRAAAFYNKQLLDHLNPLMLEYLAKQELAFIATADAHGECDCSLRVGPPGFIRALDERTLIYAELRGNGVMASMGNLSENPHIGILFLDFYESTIGLHINGRAGVVDDEAVRAFGPMLERFEPGLFQLPEGAKAAEQWVIVHVEEAYIHCSKHVPLMAKLDKDIHWATDDNVRKGGDYFKAKHSSRPWVSNEPVTAQSAAFAQETAGQVEPPAADVVPPVHVPSPAAETVAPQAPGLALAEAAAARVQVDPVEDQVTGTATADRVTETEEGDAAVASAPGDTDNTPLPDWAVDLASMSGVDWRMVADIAQRIGELEPPNPT